MTHHGHFEEMAGCHGEDLENFWICQNGEPTHRRKTAAPHDDIPDVIKFPWIHLKKRLRGHSFPIGVLSFDRPHYLREVVESLKTQVGPLDRIVLFQDGGWNRHSARMRADVQKIEQCVSIFREAFPWGRIERSEENLGVALNYERAEQCLFGELNSESALFLEDDLVLSPHYVTIIEQLLRIARHDPRIGYVSAYGNMWATHEEQEQRCAELMPMHENWGAALTRRAWLAERTFRQEYLQLIAARDYCERSHDSIRAFYKQRGWKNPITSQDAARWIACLERDEVRVTTFACHARYIGEQGVHSTKDHYRRAGFGGTRIYGGRLPRLRRPSQSEVDSWLHAERCRFQGTGHPFYPGHGAA